MPPLPLLSVVVPTRNEEANVGPLLGRLTRGPRPGSTTRSSSSTTPTTTPRRPSPRPPPRDPRVELVHREGAERGGGLEHRGGRRASTRHAASSSASWTPTSSTPPRTSPPCSRPPQAGADVVVASRYARGGSRGGLDGAGRRLVSRGGGRVARALFSEARASSDPLSGFFLCRRRVIDGIEFRPVGFKILLELLVCVPGCGCATCPSTSPRARTGTSKASAAPGPPLPRPPPLARLRRPGVGAAVEVRARRGQRAGHPPAAGGPAHRRGRTSRPWPPSCPPTCPAWCGTRCSTAAGPSPTSVTACGEGTARYLRARRALRGGHVRRLCDPGRRSGVTAVLAAPAGRWSPWSSTAWPTGPHAPPTLPVERGGPQPGRPGGARSRSPAEIGADRPLCCRRGRQPAALPPGIVERAVEQRAACSSPRPPVTAPSGAPTSRSGRPCWCRWWTAGRCGACWSASAAPTTPFDGEQLEAGHERRPGARRAHRRDGGDGPRPPRLGAAPGSLKA